MKDNMRVTIALPAYKATYLNVAIDSILNQTFVDFELIIVNDASPENIDSIVSRYNDNRITYFKNSVNIGSTNLIKQWNYCLSLAKGDYFVLASDDDIYAPTFLESLLNLSEKYPSVNVFHSRVGIIDSNGITLDYTICCAEWESSLTFIWHKICKFRNQYIPEFMFKTEQLALQGGFIDFPSAWGSDHATTFLLSYETGVVCCNEPNFMWRSSGLNISGSGNFSGNKLNALFKYIKWLTNFLNENHFNDNQELKPLILKDLRYYIEKRAPSLLMEFPAKTLFTIFLTSNYNGIKINRKLILKTAFKKVLNNYPY